MAKNSKKKRKKTGGRLVLLTILLAVLICGAILLGQQVLPFLGQSGGEADFPFELENLPDPDPIILSDGLVIHYIDGYAGSYMEDGTDEPVSDVMMIILENTTDQDLQLARISMEYAAFTAEFEVTNLPAGEKVVALEKSRQPEPSGEPQSIQTRNVVFFPQSMTLQEERIRIEGSNGTLEVTNISDEDIAGDIYIYYKNSAKDLFYGGITYRVAVKGGLAAGESTRMIAGHYTPENCRLVLVDCGD